MSRRSPNGWRCTRWPISGGGSTRRTSAAPILRPPNRVRELLRQAAAEVEDLPFSLRFLWTEWSRVVDAWQLANWEQYRDVPRLGRRTRLPERQRELLWSVFSKVAAALDEHHLLTEPRLFGHLERQLDKMARPPFEFCVVDEAQDIGVAELRFLAALGARRPDALFFAGDLGQRIFQTPFSWRALGVDIRGRSHTLRVNYRTSIRSGGRRTGCCRTRPRTWTATPTDEPAPSPYSMAPNR